MGNQLFVIPGVTVQQYLEYMIVAKAALNMHHNQTPKYLCFISCDTNLPMAVQHRLIEQGFRPYGNAFGAWHCPDSVIEATRALGQAYATAVYNDGKGKTTHSVENLRRKVWVDWEIEWCRNQIAHHNLTNAVPPALAYII